MDQLVRSDYYTARAKGNPWAGQGMGLEKTRWDDNDAKKFNTYYTEKDGKYTLKDEYSYTAHQDHPDALAIERTLNTRGRGGQTSYNDSLEKKIYKKYTPPAPTPAPAPAPEPKPEPEPALPIELSDRAAKAKSYADAYERKVLPYKGDYAFGDESVNNNFRQQYDLNLLDNRKSYINKPDNNEPALFFADNYKLSLGDTLIPRNRS